ncbi:hypothetical protein MPTK1_8g16850 [Marchantia polymorpha subsp. ruderalis]|uniref:Uncharacterized protein n=1 Tax=Marchantia polymorpha TaxID=3197 RepID=A0A2R6X839_MARPO|nr:hypothetical protein MARPO_0030s0018 [Marchantia polymorpha]BBN20154.1 hypothetical protein Mp_8g16850 [Marchantia polymorpha subsp. ruderalis]|eukprot:PTQ42268.1 hypothetical protein MARPO_0030s0018 [Marchantia polymorpha]
MAFTPTLTRDQEIEGHFESWETLLRDFESCHSFSHMTRVTVCVSCRLVHLDITHMSGRNRWFYEYGGGDGLQIPVI